MIGVSGCNKPQDTAQSDVKIIKETFKVTKEKDGEYEAKNIWDNTDKDLLWFSTDDIEGSKNIKVWCKVTGYYADRKGEDSFIIARKRKNKERRAVKKWPSFFIFILSFTNVNIYNVIVSDKSIERMIGMKKELRKINTGEEFLKACKEVVKNFSYMEVEFSIDGKKKEDILDVQTANLITSVYEKLGKENKKKFLSMHPLNMVDIAWKLVG